MADKQTESREFQMELTLVNGTEQKTRTVSFPILVGYPSAVGDFWKDVFAAQLTSKYKWLIQPANWKDDDDDEAAWQCTAAIGKIITTQVTELDTGQ